MHQTPNVQGASNGTWQPHKTFHHYPGYSSYSSYAGAGEQAKAAQREAYRAIPAEGIRAGEIVAYRCWQLSGSQRWLKSYSADKVWQPGETMEGDVESGLGIHCFKHKSSADEYCVYQGAIHVIGTIEIWGDVVEHENGYRAQFAKTKSLDYIVNYPAGRDPVPVLEELRKTYGVQHGADREAA